MCSVLHKFSHYAKSVDIWWSLTTVTTLVRLLSKLNPLMCHSFDLWVEGLACTFLFCGFSQRCIFWSLVHCEAWIKPLPHTFTWFRFNMDCFHIDIWTSGKVLAGLTAFIRCWSSVFVTVWYLGKILIPHTALVWFHSRMWTFFQL